MNLNVIACLFYVMYVTIRQSAAIAIISIQSEADTGYSVSVRSFIYIIQSSVENNSSNQRWFPATRKKSSFKNSVH